MRQTVLVCRLDLLPAEDTRQSLLAAQQLHVVSELLARVKPNEAEAPDIPDRDSC
jgi:hypothetical protein